MGFPTVKSCPYKKGLTTKRRRFVLWPESFWRRLVKAAIGEWEDDDKRPWFELVSDMNLLLYGKR